MDQVSRYYGCDDRKMNKSYKKFTVSFTISADGSILTPHCLFPKLHKKSDMNPNIFVTHSNTGMWSEAIFDEFIEEIIMKRPATRLNSEPVLLIIDSFGCHIHVIPPKLPNICQPLNVSHINSFHEMYFNLYNEYLAEASLSSIEVENCLKRLSAIKSPSHEMASNWVWEWTQQISAEIIKECFEMCGIGLGKIDHNSLSQPLKELFEIDGVDWEVNYSDLVTKNEMESVDDLFCPENSTATFYRCFHYAAKIEIDFDSWFDNIIGNVISFCCEEWSDVFSLPDWDEMKTGKIVTGAEIYAISKMANKNIVVKSFDSSNYINSEKRFKG
ncbi:CLUMA_CG020467, isoform A [Clunio marinus]|uniref:CLUMA_CG020467, isoform A n=1 Tax=Clunio marinus TaxID=568069 RepID=A0A1J1J517_9DIPT|nr:CLUMA_CG020467, isoform A [Clunio marinus]